VKIFILEPTAQSAVLEVSEGRVTDGIVTIANTCDTYDNTGRWVIIINAYAVYMLLM
jgi:hypothetical protein